MTRRARRTVAVVCMAIAAVFGTSVYALSAITSCSGGETTLDAAVAPELAPALSAVAGDFNGADHRAGGKCVRVTVRAAGPAGVTALLSGQIPRDSGVRRPDVWVPDSSLWLRLLTTPPRVTGGPLARTPLVAAVPAAQAARTPASWKDLLDAAEPGERRSQAVRPVLADPARTGAGLAALLIAREREGDAAFAAFARSVRESTAPDAAHAFAALTGASERPEPVLVLPEQAVWEHERRKPSVPVQAVYPRDGTLSLDYPVAVLDDRPGARLFERALHSGPARERLRSAGFRDPGGRAPAGLPAARPAVLADPDPALVRRTAQEWARLTLGSRMLSVIDVSGSMAQPVPGSRLTRMQAIAQASQQGLALQPDDTELGQWIFSTRLDGDRDWRQTVPMGPLGGRIGSVTRRQRILSTLAALHPKPDGATGLYDTVLAAVRYMRRTYRPEMVNTVLLFTDGRNDDPGGPSLDRTVAALRAERRATRPVQIIVIGFGPDVDTAELRRLAGATGGSVYTARAPQDILRIFGEATARRLCAPSC
ncbi:substrate-binding and VWA domain-containing protein [Actinomadura opuntiae]|uniref:substrate-binding and VWA domain-containing protein n=1 Tax=Actinomadura sp. OS1-43 TaxID=604315 RepID=UPI00255A7693|nr:substrate-binding and VWA domain-containing protein [Actinomadura sp. OS1-43]MDL4820212.1 substrate-binding and VWA domain-containing protein [Actinomadura sp. OS1-43]